MPAVLCTLSWIELLSFGLEISGAGAFEVCKPHISDVTKHQTYRILHVTVTMVEV